MQTTRWECDCHNLTLEGHVVPNNVRLWLSMRDNQLLARIQTEKMSVKKIKIADKNNTMICTTSETCSEICCSHCHHSFTIAVGPRNPYVTKPQALSPKAQRRHSTPAIRQPVADIGVPSKLKRYVEIVEWKSLETQSPESGWNDLEMDELQLMFAGAENPVVGHYVEPLYMC